MITNIWWIRRDLRLHDNNALATALANGDQVQPVFIIDPTLLDSPYAGSKRVAFLQAGLQVLDADLRRRGSYLLLKYGQPATVLAALQSQLGARRVIAEIDYSPYARQRDERVAATVPLQLTPGVTAKRPDDIHKADGTPYTVFTPFSKAWRREPLPPTAPPLPATIPTPPQLAGDAFPVSLMLSAQIPFPAGETEARQRLKQFLNPDVDQPGIWRYAETRNLLDVSGTSLLSPYLRFGMLSPRQAVVAALEAIELAPDQAAIKAANTWLNELIWREFYIAILYHFPRVRQRNFQAKYDHIVWKNDKAEFAAWGAGRTGYPVVDAAMHQLLQTGWMHNRARMITASFLVKDLLIDWRWGEKFFMQHLVDGDPAANNGGWQWTAGTGTDAAPYFRVFNPILQSKKFDPGGDYLRRWLPALANVPTKYIHEPWTMSPLLQREVGCVIGQNYPAPMVEHKQARQRTLAAYKVEA